MVGNVNAEESVADERSDLPERHDATTFTVELPTEPAGSAITP